MILASNMLKWFSSREDRNMKLALWNDSLVLLKIYLRLAGKLNESEELTTDQMGSLMDFQTWSCSQGALMPERILNGTCALEPPSVPLCLLMPSFPEVSFACGVDLANHSNSWFVQSIITLA